MRIFMPEDNEGRMIQYEERSGTKRFSLPVDFREIVAINKIYRGPWDYEIVARVWSTASGKHTVRIEVCEEALVALHKATNKFFNE